MARTDRRYLLYWNNETALLDAWEFLNAFPIGSQERSVAYWTASAVRYHRVTPDFQAKILQTAIAAGWTQSTQTYCPTIRSPWEVPA